MFLFCKYFKGKFCKYVKASSDLYMMMMRTAVFVIEFQSNSVSVLVSTLLLVSVFAFSVVQRAFSVRAAFVQCARKCPTFFCDVCVCCAVYGVVAILVIAYQLVCRAVDRPMNDGARERRLFDPSVALLSCVRPSVRPSTHPLVRLLVSLSVC